MEIEKPNKTKKVFTQGGLVSGSPTPQQLKRVELMLNKILWEDFELTFKMLYGDHEIPILVDPSLPRGTIECRHAGGIVRCINCASA